MLARPLINVRPAVRSYERERLDLADGATTTLHIASFARDAVRARVVSLGQGRPLLACARERGWRDAVVGGFASALDLDFTVVPTTLASTSRRG